MNIAISLLVFCFVAFLERTYGEGHLEHHYHNKKLHADGSPLHHHSRHHHKALKSRNGPGCVEICDPELVAVTKWLNNTNELKVLYQLIPPSLKQALLNGTSTTPPSINASSWLNGLNLNGLYDSSAEWPIVTYFSKIIGFWLSRARSILELFQMFPQFANIWKVILHGMSGGCENSDILINNLKGLFGSNESFGVNLFNFTYWENLFSPSSFIKGIEHAFENGFDALTNVSSIVSKSSQRAPQ
ncbi:uncharacterized protein LOC126737009 [Anthonomus grandis grandis]|uniref:uncharacterized protein LOC126737009 n=1 Tax=Anthonomus grandis grandis TaxID=2921223 RepID=UPI002165918D|nr:uncharacterized protein LOC126737009 [Anthonomus grandis grandis]